MGSVALVVHQHRHEAVELAIDALDWLAAEGHQVALPADDARLVGAPDLAVDLRSTPCLDLVVSLGGDGTMLRAVDLVSGHDVPVLGVHVGQLGYLVEVDPPDFRRAVTAFFAGEHRIEERMRLAVEVEGVDGPSGEGTGPGTAGPGGAGGLGGVGAASGTALNEAVLEKTPLGHTVRLKVSVDGEHFTTYTADGLIVATPTGSTAYALSARAPIVAPAHRALVLTPVAPHHLFDRTLVLDPRSHIRIEVTSYRPAKVFLDGRELATLGEGMAVCCTASDHPARLVTFHPRNFLGILKSKFGLNEH
jgi:NAD+ kinase